MHVAYIETLFIEKDFIECFLNLRQYDIAVKYSHVYLNMEENVENGIMELSAYNNTRKLVLTDIKWNLLYCISQEHFLIFA